MAGSYGLSPSAGAAASLPGGAGPMPGGFLEDLVAHFNAQAEAEADDDEGGEGPLPKILKSMGARGAAGWGLA